MSSVRGTTSSHTVAVSPNVPEFDYIDSATEPASAQQVPVVTETLTDMENELKTSSCQAGPSETVPFLELNGGVYCRCCATTTLARTGGRPSWVTATSSAPLFSSPTAATVPCPRFSGMSTKKNHYNLVYLLHNSLSQCYPAPAPHTTVRKRPCIGTS
jgi:hypothetical protein